MPAQDIETCEMVVNWIVVIVTLYTKANGQFSMIQWFSYHQLSLTLVYTLS